jgi:UDP-3-O-[3-hydroxymyristoyl] N-acetylglucosamine deacetylase/3-hydroxyacyl-[acyl-carrier-protein] dehydratase
MARDSVDCQTTILEPAVLDGIGLHTGNPSRITFRPAPANTGIRFFREDLPGIPMIPARLNFVVATVRGTNLGLGDAKVHTVEHVLAAITGIGIDNVDVSVNSNEPPAMDGSALPFAKALLKAGLQRFPDQPKRALRLPGEVVYEDRGSRYRAVPSEWFSVKATILHDHPLIPSLEMDFRFDPGAFLSDVAPARTFCFEHEVAFLRSQGLAQGGSLDNAIVVGRDRILTNSNGLRFPDEFVRHKALDLIGDLALIGRSLFHMRVEAVRPGHAHNIEFAMRLRDAAMRMRGQAPVPGSDRRLA